MKKIAALGLSLMFGCAHAQQSLEARDLDGNGTVDAYYQATQGLTWLADANYYATLGLPADISRYGNVGEPLPPGVLRWSTANSFAAGLTLGGVDDWRLPSRLVPTSGGYEGSEECPVECVMQMPGVGSGIRSELSFLQGATGQFVNLMSGIYMTSSPGWNWEEYRNMTTGFAGTTDEVGLLSGYAMVVRTGDLGYSVGANGTVTPVPEPGTYALMLVGLAGLGWTLARRSSAGRMGGSGIAIA